MGVEHQVAKMTAHGVQITGEGFGGTGELSQTDIAAALAGLHGQAYWLMRLKYCADTSMLARLVDAVAFQMLGEAMVSDEDVSAHTAKGLALVAVMQATLGPICDDCHGTGTAFTKDSATDCVPCRGTGRLAMTQDRAAGIAGMTRKTYAKTYSRLVDRAVSRLEAFESLGFTHVRRQIYD
tara:strand:+ start:14489 stop:15031 length:543 start_codon:yes stop_codon:yes gene_type:complete